MEFFGFDIVALVRASGYAGIAFIVFAETGLFVGFFLPGDSLLFTAGFLASQGYLSIGLLTALIVLGAILGNIAGYEFGKRIGPRIFRRERSFFFNKDNIERARKFYERYGGKAVFFGRFLPIVRTFVPILAGVGGMGYRSFLWYNALGGFMWGAGLPLLGYFLGSAVPHADRYLVPIILAIIVISILPSVFHVARARRAR